MSIRLAFFVCAFLFCSLAEARHEYYPASFQDQFHTKQLKNENLKNKLFKILSTPHQKNANAPDTLGCEPTAPYNDWSQSDCYEQVDLGYRRAREILFGSLHLERDWRGEYFINDMYCNIAVTEKMAGVGRYQIPDHTVINTEHTWPQSRFSQRFPAGLQRADLHHLFPVDPLANNVRGNNEMADVIGEPIREHDCRDSTFGQDILSGKNQRFEPPEEYKGKIARALFYFSIRYQVNISPEEERHLRSWHRDYPPSRFEKQRNDKIYEYQQNRNPFIDYPELVGMIENF